MDNLVFFKAILLITLGLLILLLISYSVYLIFKKYKKPKIGKIAGIIFFVVLSFVIGIIIATFPFDFYNNYFFFKKDVRQILGEADIVLSDDFKILDNKVSEFTSQIHTFKLKISEQDEKKLIKDSKQETHNNKILIRWNDKYGGDEKIILNTKKHTLYYEYINN